MSTKPSFSDQMMNRFFALETRVQHGSKSLRLISSYFSIVRKEVDTFRKTLSKSLSPLVQCLQLNKKPDDTLFVGLKSLIRNMEEYFNFMGKTCVTCQSEVIEPFDIFISNYDQCNRTVLKQGVKIIEQVEAHKAKVAKAKERYGKCAKAFVNTGSMEKELLKAKEKAMIDAKAEYQYLVEEHNVLLEKKQEEYRQSLDMVEQNEQTRVSLIAKNLAKVFALSVQMAEEYAEANAKTLKMLQEVDPIKDLEMFVADLSRTAKTDTFNKVLFEDHGEIYQRIDALNYSKEKSVDLSEGDEILLNADFEEAFVSPTNKSEAFILLETPEEIIQNACQNLLSGKDLSTEEKVKIPEAFTQPYGRRLFAEVLSNVSNKHFIEDFAAFETLGQIVNTLLTMFALHKDKDTFILWTVLSAGFLIYSRKLTDKGKLANVPLRELTSGNSIWRTRDQWIRIIQYRLTKSLSRVKLAPVPREKGKATPKDNLTRKSVIFSELSAIGGQMALMGVERIMGRDLLLQFTGYYRIDSDKLCEVLLDYEGAQALPREIQLDRKEIQGVFKAKYEKTWKKYGENKEGFVIGKSIGYVGDIVTLRNLLLLNKGLNKLLRTRIYKKVLTFPDIHPGVRRELWKHAILDQSLLSIYKEIKAEKLAKYLVSGKASEETIRLDVIRSFHIHDEESQEAIMNVLRCYAIHNPQIEYCQGMNFIAGLFYLIYKDEALAFAMFSSFITSMNISGFYKQDVPLLKLYIYQMNRLIALYLPALHSHLYEEGINAMYFCSAWLLTSFAYILQYSKDTKIPPLLLAIFDKYLFDGCEVLFRTSLFILSHFEEALLDMKYEGLVQFLNEVPKSDFFRDEAAVKKYLQNVKKFKLSKELMGRLEEEEGKICETSEKRINLVAPSKSEFKYYLESEGKHVAVYFSY